VQTHFNHINEDKGLTEADKKQLKDFYLQHMVAPDARRLLEEEIAREKARKERHFRTGGPHHRDRL
jgi:hypothetical protein